MQVSWCLRVHCALGNFLISGAPNSGHCDSSHCHHIVKMSVPPGPMPAPDMSGVDPGLQPTLIALLYLFPGLALAVLLVRFWRKSVDHLLGGGGYHLEISTECMGTDSYTDDAIIGIAWVLCLGNSIITHLCKQSADYTNRVRSN
jgi:hypothetical protein